MFLRYLLHILIFPLYVLVILYDKWAYRHYTRDRQGSIRIVDFNADSSDDEDFVVATREALDLIRRRDPRRCRMMQRELRYIVNEELVSGGNYYRPLRACRVDFGRYKLDQPTAHYEWYLAQYASTLIHEATHARLASRGINYTPELRAWIERMCVTEQQRFARRLKSDRYNFARDLVRPFTPDRWKPYWNMGLREHLKGILARVEESRDRARLRSLARNDD